MYAIQFVIAESVMKDVFKFCKAKCCSNLALWKDSITNMLWYSFASSGFKKQGKITKSLFFSCVGSEEELKEKVLSMLHHCSDCHCFPNNKVHKACSHGDLSMEERNKPWLGEVVSYNSLMSSNE